MSAAAAPTDIVSHDPFAELIAEIVERRAEIDRLSHVPRDLVGSMKKAGIFRAGTPRMFGGDALPPADFLRMVEAVSTADGSAGWVAAFGSANTYLAALPVETQRMIYASGPDQVFAGGMYPLHKARSVDGGWTVSGQWRFASGCMGADWIGVGISVDEPGDEAGGGATPRMAVAPADEVEIIQNWNVVGMQGTGSYDTKVTDKYYAREWTFGRGALGVIDEPLYRYPPLAYQAEVHAVVNIGLARAALDVVADMGGAAKMMPGAAKLADRSYYRSALAKGEAQWRSARAFFYESSEQAWATIIAGDPLSIEQHSMLRLSATHAAHSCAEVAQQAYRVAGMAAIQKTHRLQQIVRDTMVVIHHASLGEAIYEDAGAILAGVSPKPGYP